MTFHYEGHLGGFITEGDSRSWTPLLWEHLLSCYGVSTCLDVGCGMGFEANWFFRKGVDVVGVDGSAYAAERTVLPKDRFVQHDFCVGPYIHKRVDLIWSCEFLEHVEEQFLPNIMKTFQQGSVIACTAAAPGQGGYHHVNCQPLRYWVSKFADAGLAYDEKATEMAKASLNGDHSHRFFRETGMIFRGG